MFKIITAIFIVSLCGYAYNEKVKKDNKAKALAVEEARIAEGIKKSLYQMIGKTNADQSWQATLGDKNRSSFSPILTIELERLWLIDSPILFFGSILEIKSEDEKNYKILIDRSRLSIAGNDLQMLASSPKKIIDNFLLKYPRILGGSKYSNNVAVAVKVNKVITQDLLDEEAYVDEIKMGYGNLIGITYVGSMLRNGLLKECGFIYQSTSCFSKTVKK